MLVPAGSPIRRVADADKPGIRIAAVRGHSSTMTLTGTIKQAEVILGDNEHATFELLRAGRADAFASTRQLLTDFSADCPARACWRTATARTSTGWWFRKATPDGSPT